MLIKKYKIPLFIAVFIILTLVTTTVFAVNGYSGANQDNKAQQKIDDTSMVNQLSSEFQVSGTDIKKLKDDVKEWKKVYHKLLIDKRKQKAVSEERFKEFNAKYSPQDIRKAEEYSALCGYSADEILQAKGDKRNFDTKVEMDAKGNEKRTVTDNTRKLWDDASKKLNIDFLTPAFKLGISDQDIKSMKTEGMTSREIYEIGMMALNFNRDYAKVWSDYKTGLTIEELEGKYTKEVKGKVIFETKPNVDDKTKRDNLLKNAFKITDEETAMFKSNGITEYLDMANAKHYSAKNNISINKVIELKKSKGSWDKVSEALGGDK